MKSNPSLLARTLGCLFALLVACTAPARPSEEKTPAEALFLLVRQPEDEETTARIEALIRTAITRVERYFGAPFPRPFTITIHPDRAAFDASFPPEWGMPKTECWMVATGVADGVQILSPRVWEREACEHDAADELHVERLLAHELVHVFHGQHNPSPDFVDVTGIDWFVEGLATLASGQLEDTSQLSAREALERGAGPSALASAWTGRYRYGVSGSLVAFLEHELGRARIIESLVASSGEELLDLLGMSESELLERWRAWVLAGSPERRAPARLCFFPFSSENGTSPEEEPGRSPAVPE